MRAGTRYTFLSEGKGNIMNTKTVWISNNSDFSSMNHVFKGFKKCMIEQILLGVPYLELIRLPWPARKLNEALLGMEKVFLF